MHALFRQQGEKLLLVQECRGHEAAEDQIVATRKALQTHMEFDAEKQTDTDYA